MKKIAIIAADLLRVLGCQKGGGGEILLKNFIQELLEIPDVSVSVFAAENVPQSIKEHYFSIIFRSYNCIEELNEILKKEYFDKILNFNMFIPFKTTVLQCHSLPHRLNKNCFFVRFIKKFLLRGKIAYQKIIFSNPQVDYIAVSQTIKDDYSNNFGIPPSKIKVIYPGVRLLSETVKHEKGIITFGIVANSSINKGGHYLLTALGILNILGRNFKLKVIAPKFNQDILMQFIIFVFNLRKKIEILPFQHNMADFYKNIDSLVIPSLNEAFGLVTLEAMSFGNVCLVSSSAGSSEIIENKENGFIFNRKSFIDFIKKIDNIINLYNNNFEYFKSISDKSLSTAASYSWKDFALKVIND